MKSIINSQLPSFSLQAYHNGAFKTVTEKDVLGKWSVLFFYPADFAPTALTELTGLTEIQEKLHDMGIQIFAVSADSWLVHKAWYNHSAEIQKIAFPMLADRVGTLSLALGIMSEEDNAITPSSLIINPEGEIKVAGLYDQSVVRTPDELMRKLKAAIFVANNPDEVCPAKWNEGYETLKPTMDLIGKI